MTPEQYKRLSIREFTKAAKAYETDHAGIYEMCRDDYPPMLAELETDPFDNVLDVGCGTGPVIELLAKKYPEKHFVGLDITPAMIEAARSKGLSNAEFVVGDAESLPFGDEGFDAVLCSNSFHHYPNPGAFLREAHRVLRPGGKLILRDYTSNDVVVWLMNTFEMPLARLVGHGDVRILKMGEYRELVEAAGFAIEKLVAQKGFRAHLVARK
ncbi:class I SAM-dependent methyltransferase [Olsenella massiliensis]|uniref:class I SAM-dependent methyltransferase n=1 Tax=Olsenella massiliensis TaxID=1622075 RepID=UPI00071E3BC1|nr:class I SAM-dependent methyltransferase [Olsenella massiliensis]